MKFPRSVFSYLVSALICGLLVLRFIDSSGEKSTLYPNRPVQVVVPYAAGGGTDTFVRIIQKAVASKGLLPEPLVIINQPGGGGTIGSRYVKESRPDGYRILCHNEAIITSQLSGTVPFGPDDLAPIAQTGNIAPMIVVREDSRFQDLNALLAESKEKPNSLRFGADVGSLAHFMAMEIEQSSPGSAFNYITCGGGQKRFTLLLGGHLDAAIFSLSEYLAFRAANETPPHQNIRAIAVLQSNRHDAVPHVSTAMEQGVPINVSSVFYWWAPKGTPADAVDQLADMFEVAMQDPSVVEELAKISIGSGFRRGEELLDYIDKRIETLSAFAVSFPAELPNFPAWVIAIVGVFAAGIGINALLNRKVATGLSANRGERNIALTALGMLVLYIACLQWGLPYVIATTPAIFILGATIAGWDRRRLFSIGQLALLFALGSEFVFARIFTVPLP